jgi:hypothetical protein
MKLARIAIASALLIVSGNAAAQSASDVGCLMVSNVFAKDTSDANKQKLAQALTFFYLGRINATTTAQLKTRMDQEGKTITDANAGPMMNNCVKEFQAKLQLVQSLEPAEQAKPAQPSQKPKPAQPQGR